MFVQKSKIAAAAILNYYFVTPVMSLTFWGHVTSSVTWPLDSAYVVSYWRSILTMHFTCTVTEIWAPKILRSRFWLFGVTWRYRSRDHRTWRRHISIGSQWWPCVYLAPIRRYGASKILGSRVWPFGVTWRHRSRDRWIWHMWFLLVVHWNHASILHPNWDIGPQTFWSHKFDLLRLRDVVVHVTIGLDTCDFLLVVHLN